MRKLSSKPRLYAVVLAGGQGRRFWPRSRACRPKQMLAIGCAEPMVRETVQRLLPLVPRERLLVSAGEELGPELSRLLPELKKENFILEPAPRDTAAGIGLAIAQLQARLEPGVREEEIVIAVLPADHVIKKPAVFRATLSAAVQVAYKQGLIMTIGILPDRPSSAYGYLQPGAPVPGYKKARWVKRFVEKPEEKTARRYLAQGYLWNAGMFIFRLDVIGAAYRQFLPEMAKGLGRIREALREGGAERVLRREFPKLARTSIDYGIMEKAKNLALIPGDFGWCDVGGWDACYRLLGGDGQKNIKQGPGEFVEARGCYLESQKFTALVGVSDLVVIDTEDALLILRRDREDALKKLTQKLSRQGRTHLL